MGKEAAIFFKYISKLVFIFAVSVIGLIGMAKGVQAQVDCTPETCGPPPAPVTCIEPPQTMIHWWTCDDLTDHNSSYPLTGAPSLSLVGANGATLTPGFVGNACLFNTADYYADNLFFIPDDPSMNPGDGSFTVEMWVNPSTQNNFGEPFIRFGNPGTTALNFYSIAQSTGGGWIGYVGDGVSQVELDGPAVEPGTWHHIALVIDRSASVPTNVDATGYSSAILYYDGAEVTRSDISRLGSINPSGYDARVGAEGYLGMVDEISLYNSALTREEIGGIFTSYNTGKGKVDSDHDGCADCRDSACDMANLSTGISYQGMTVANPIYAANAAYADATRINSTSNSNNKVAIAVDYRFSTNDPTTPKLTSEVFHLVGVKAKLPLGAIGGSQNQTAVQLCATALGLPTTTSKGDVCATFAQAEPQPTGAGGQSCHLACLPPIITGPNCGTTQPIGLGCREMTRAEVLAGGTCKDQTTGLPFQECCPYPPNITHNTVTSGQITPSISGNSLFVSDGDGCCIRQGGCKLDTLSSDSSTDNFIHNYYYDNNSYCQKTPKPTGCP